jgi:putative hydrolase of the HAD superfamily
MSARVEALLFDLGGVVIELDWERTFSHWARCAGKPVAPIRAGFAFDVPYQRHERGEIDAAAYYDSLRRSLQLDITDKQFDFGWKALFVSEIRETVDMIKVVRGRIPMYLFSNSNAAHKEAWASGFADALEPFDRIFVSSEIGRRKPSRESFEHIATEIGVPPASILFFDDTLENVEGARASGLQAVHVRSPQDVRDALRPWLPGVVRHGM